MNRHDRCYRVRPSSGGELVKLVLAVEDGEPTDEELQRLVDNARNR